MKRIITPIAMPQRFVRPPPLPRTLPKFEANHPRSHQKPCPPGTIMFGGKCVGVRTK